MVKMVHSDRTNPIRTINNQGREYRANDDGEFDVEDSQVDPMKSFGLVEKDTAGEDDDEAAAEG
jgi:hypothetical protein